VTFIVTSSNGNLVVLEDGRVFVPASEYFPEPVDEGCTPLTSITRFDVDEFTRTYGHAPATAVDILDLGYWWDTVEGVEQYEPPAQDWRTMMAGLGMTGGGK